MTAPIVILAHDALEYEAQIRKAGLTDLPLISCTRVTEARPHLAQCEILFAVPDMAVRALEHAPKLKWLQSMWAGITPLMAPALPRHYQLTGVKGIFGPLMSEYLICHMLMHERQVLFRHQCQQEKRWDQTVPGSLAGKTLGVMGIGSIGAHVAATAQALGMTVKGFARTRSQCPGMDEVFGPDRILEFAQDLDYLVTILPDTAATDNLINDEFLAALPHTAVYLNVGRGNVVDEPALVRALEKGTLSGAVLDVFKTEPLPRDHPFWESPNTVLTFHTAAMSSPELVTPIFTENYRRYRAGEPLNYPIDFTAGY